tara:strand:- start:239 stop:436 length:198 start_codon:yes stop_codon:yes gene_type:complete
MKSARNFTLGDLVICNGFIGSPRGVIKSFASLDVDGPIIILFDDLKEHHVYWSDIHAMYEDDNDQ